MSSTIISPSEDGIPGGWVPFDTAPAEASGFPVCGAAATGKVTAGTDSATVAGTCSGEVGAFWSGTPAAGNVEEEMSTGAADSIVAAL